MAPRDGFGSNVRRLGRSRARSLGGGSGSSGKPTYNPSGSRGGDSPKPLGVPEDYSTPFQRTGTYSARGGESAANWRGMGETRQDRTPGTIGTQKPRYFEGDEWDPAGLGPAAIGSLQEHMAASGLLGGEWRYGIWDTNTVAAYKAVLTEANAMGLSANAVIRLRGQSTSFGGSGGGTDGSGGGSGGGGTWQYDENGNPVFVPDPEDVYTPEPLPIQTTNKDDLRSLFRRSVIETLGQGWSQAQIDELVEAYNWQEIKVQKDKYDQEEAVRRAEFEGTRAGTGGEVITEGSVASPEAFLENEMIRRDPEGYKAGRLVQSAIPAFMAAMRSWG